LARRDLTLIPLNESDLSEAKGSEPSGFALGV
jgi:hypothetical protein